MDPIMSAVVGTIFFSAFFCASLAGTGRRRPSNHVEPNSVLPTIIDGLMPTAGSKPFIGPVPWNVQRRQLTCQLPNCSTGSAYVVDLPVLSDPDASGWSKTINAWQLSTQEYMRTGWPFLYPVATVLNVPSDTPKNVMYLVDPHLSDNGFQGLKPMITDTNGLLDMGPNWNSGLLIESPEGRNVTGNYAHSFVLHNMSDHDVYFTKQQLEGPGSVTQWWTCRSNSWTLFWPSRPYFSFEIGPIAWNAYTMPSNTSNDFAAYVAEILMYQYLAPQNPQTV
jgi:hypothetical protein